LASSSLIYIRCSCTVLHEAMFIPLLLYMRVQQKLDGLRGFFDGGRSVEGCASIDGSVWPWNTFWVASFFSNLFLHLCNFTCRAASFSLFLHPIPMPMPQWLGSVMIRDAFSSYPVLRLGVLGLSCHSCPRPDSNSKTKVDGLPPAPSHLAWVPHFEQSQPVACVLPFQRKFNKAVRARCGEFGACCVVQSFAQFGPQCSRVARGSGALRLASRARFVWAVARCLKREIVARPARMVCPFRVLMQ
jgi:hypothetical protein